MSKTAKALGILAAAFTMHVATARAANAPLLYPKMWGALEHRPAEYRNQFKCDYTARACQVSAGSNDWQMFIMLDDRDRKRSLHMVHAFGSPAIRFATTYQ